MGYRESGKDNARIGLHSAANVLDISRTGVVQRIPRRSNEKSCNNGSSFAGTISSDWTHEQYERIFGRFQLCSGQPNESASWRQMFSLVELRKLLVWFGCFVFVQIKCSTEWEDKIVFMHSLNWRGITSVRKKILESSTTYRRKNLIEIKIDITMYSWVCKPDLFT